MKNIIFLLFLQLMAVKAYSCSCAFGSGELEDQVKQAFENASAVVLAKVESIEKLEPYEYQVEIGSSKKETSYNRHKTHFSEIKSWKGEHGKQFYTDIVVACCMCGFHFEEGKEYLLYLYGPNEEGYFSTSVCSRTTRLTDEANQEIEVLNDLLK
ncbi:hypothetical protein [Microbulbifer taiwanensis]|uniref:Uncharacterized protein n=1 Tax=Microbulbifer taiwanensis TaxID=986746 RepID=A0ABW1YTN7_9GAMM|nr:hypothetical protein [Microbulbifer taiwanensis]